MRSLGRRRLPLHNIGEASVVAVSTAVAAGTIMAAIIVAAFPPVRHSTGVVARTPDPTATIRAVRPGIRPTRDALHAARRVARRTGPGESAFPVRARILALRQRPATLELELRRRRDTMVELPLLLPGSILVLRAQRPRLGTQEVFRLRRRDTMVELPLLFPGNILVLRAQQPQPGTQEVFRRR